jgi:hypothetical protein
MIAINLDIRFTGMRLAVHAYAAFRIKLYERPLPFISFGFTVKNNHEHAVRGDIFLSLDGGMVCLSVWMNNTSLGILDLLHVYVVHDVELMARSCV